LLWINLLRFSVDPYINIVKTKFIYKYYLTESKPNGKINKDKQKSVAIFDIFAYTGVFDK
jgi:hypothetical protein